VSAITTESDWAVKTSWKIGAGFIDRRLREVGPPE
jgi:hypothetical protein